MVEAGLFDVLVVTEMTRLARPDDLTSLGSLDVFKRHGVLINSGGSELDVRSPEGFLSSGIMSILGGYERLAMIRKMLASKEASRANGFCPSSAITLPLGLEYNRSTNRFAYNAEIWRVREAFRLVDEDGIRNLSEIGRRVGIQHRTLKNQLENKSYIGVREYSKMRDQSTKAVKAGGRQGDRKKVNRPAEKVIRARIFCQEEQAVSDERFSRVQQFLLEMADRHARFVAPHKGHNPLSSIGFCGFCGQRLYSTTSSRKSVDGIKVRGYLICKSHHYQFRKRLPNCSQGWMRREQMDELVSAFALRFLEDPLFLSAILKHAKSKQCESIVNIGSDSQLRREISDLDKRDRRVLDAIEAGAMSLAEAKQVRARLAESKRGLLATLANLSPSDTGEVLPQGVIGRIASMGPAAWTSLSCGRERKELLATLFMEIFVRGESITAFRLAPSLVGPDSGDWRWLADVPITLPEPYTVTPPPEVVEIPAGHRQCTRCRSVLPAEDFYGKRPACRSCDKARNNARYRERVERLKQHAED